MLLRRSRLRAWVVAPPLLLATACGGKSKTTRGHGAADAPANAASCSELPAECGPEHDEECCASPLVPGGMFYRSYDATTATFPGPYTSTEFPARVSDFRLDRYEVTVARFRRFAAAYSQAMLPSGAGKNPNDPDDAGWDTAWNANLPSDAQALTDGLECDAVFQTWTNAPDAREQSPMNCLSWYEAFAFCSWDGGRLPTEAEWNYAAAGGSEQRVYPWSSPATSSQIDCDHANYYQNGPDTFAYCQTQADGNGTTDSVGSQSPAGDGKFGQADLSGNVEEWTLDAYTESYANRTCSDCADTAPAALRVVRGGGFSMAPENQYASYRNGWPADAPDLRTGVRCARAP